MTWRLPDAMRLGRVVLQIADLERSIAYYERVIGFTVIERSGGRALLGPAGGPVIVELRERRGANPIPRRGRLGLYHFAILLPDRPSLGSFLAHAQSLGGHIGMSDHLVSEALYLWDPDGLGIEVYRDRPRESWTKDGDEIAMATDPLDVASVLEAGAGQPWTGAPPGTTLGHVHLFVGDLPPARTFYHDGLGLEVMVSHYPGALFMSAGGYHHHLAVNTWAAGVPPAGEDDARLLEWEVVLPTRRDAEQALASLTALGNPTERSEDGGSSRDPWGTAVRIRGLAA